MIRATTIVYLSCAYVGVLQSSGAQLGAQRDAPILTTHSSSNPPIKRLDPRSDEFVQQALQMQADRAPGYGLKMRMAASAAFRLKNRERAESLLSGAMERPESLGEGISALAMRARYRVVWDGVEGAREDMELLRAIVVASAGNVPMAIDVYSSLNIYSTRLASARDPESVLYAEAVLLLAEVSPLGPFQTTAVVNANSTIVRRSRDPEAAARLLETLEANPEHGIESGSRGSQIVSVIQAIDRERANAAYLPMLEREWQRSTDAYWNLTVGVELAARLGKARQQRARVAVLMEIVDRIDRHREKWIKGEDGSVVHEFRARSIDDARRTALVHLTDANFIGLHEVARDAADRLSRDETRSEREREQWRERVLEIDLDGKQAPR